jgi:hypothetical protein
LVDREEPHSSSCRSCRHTKEEMQKRKLQRVPKIIMGRVFSSNHTSQDYSSQRCYAATRSNSNSAALSCTGLPCHSERKECLTSSLEAQTTKSSKSASLGF